MQDNSFASHTLLTHKPVEKFEMCFMTINELQTHM